MSRITAVLAGLALAGCGDWSSEDVRFLAALPTREDLRVAVPADAAPGALAACEHGPASLWLNAKPTSDGLNAGVDFLVRLVDAVRRIPPTERLEDERRWGPWDDEKHPGRELQVRIVRSGEGAAVVHAYVLEARVKGQGAWLPVLSGEFRGPSAERGLGSLELSFDALWSVGLNDADTPRGAMRATYDRTSDPRTVEIALGEAGFGVRPFEYGYAGYASGAGWFEYRIPKNLDTLTITAAFDPAGAGRAQVTYLTWLGLGGAFRQCWDPAACLTYVDDPNDYSCGAPPCSLGAPGACAPVPSPPFP